MRRENFLGFPIDVVDEHDIAQQAELGDLHPYVVVRCTDTDPTAGSRDLRRRRTRTLCELCGELCYLDTKSFDEIRALKTLIVCTRCMLDWRDEVQARVDAHRNEEDGRGEKDLPQVQG